MNEFLFFISTTALYFHNIYKIRAENHNYYCVIFSQRKLDYIIQSTYYIKIRIVLKKKNPNSIIKSDLNLPSVLPHDGKHTASSAFCPLQT